VIVIFSSIFSSFFSSVLLLTTGRLVSITVPSIIDIHCRVHAPIGMDAFIIVEMRDPNLVACNPDIAGTQIDISAADETDEFETVPDIRIRDEYDGRGLHDNRWWRWHRSNYYRSWSDEGDSTGFNYAPRN
jgi:hypothetical protein